MADLVATPNTTGPIYIPAWDDVIKLQPRPTVTAAQRRQFNTWEAALPYTAGSDAGAKRALRERSIERGESGLPPAIALDLSRSRFIANQMSESQIPAWRQRLLRIVNALDNIQDDIATVAWIAGPVIRRLPGGAVLNDIIQGTGTAISAIEHSIAGPNVLSRSAKRKALRNRPANANTRKGVMGFLQKGVGWLRANQGHLVEAAQSANTHLGVGLALGGIFAALEEVQDRGIASAWNLGKLIVSSQVARILPAGSDVRASLDAQSDEYMNNIRKAGAGIGPEIIRAGLAAQLAISNAATLALPPPLALGLELLKGSLGFLPRAIQAKAAAYVGQDNPYFTAGEHALALYGGAANNALLATAFRHATEYADFEQLADMPAARTIVRPGPARDELEHAGCTFDAHGRALGAWAEPIITVRQATDKAIADYQKNNHAWLSAEPVSLEDRFMHALGEAYLPTAALQLTGDANGITPIWEPEYRAAMMLFDLGAYPPMEITQEALHAWMHDQVEYINAHQEDYNQRDAARITQRHWTIQPPMPN